MGRRTPLNPFLRMPDPKFDMKSIERDGRDFVETMDQIDTDLLDDESLRELDDISSGLHGFGWGSD